ncbi:MAG: HAMP domain-containing protein [Alphaproteobacteria bacterium]|nr:HAMP domain-containing protein [Alphaproteobacteria bacterium]
MRSLFLRLYLGTLLTLLVAGAVTFGLTRERFAYGLTSKTQLLVEPSMRQIRGALEQEGEAARGRLEQEYGFPLVLEPDPELSDAERRALTSGEVVVILEGGRPVALTRVALEPPVVARLGPLPGFTPTEDGRGPLAVLILMSLLVVGTALQGLPLVRQLQALSRTAEAFGEGALDARAPVLSGDAAGQLAERFNHMAERIAALLDGQRELLRAISHDLRTPLSRLRFGLALLEEGDSPAQREARVAAMEADLDALDAMLGELLRFARLDRAATPFLPEPVALEEALASAAERARRLGSSARLELTPGAPARLPVEPASLERALDNLLGNALRHAASLVRLSWVLEPGQVCVFVDDDGPGVAPEHRERIFEPFARLEGHRGQEQGQGSGLGLAIVRRIAERHEGAVSVESSPLGGARFTLRLPR